MFEDELQQCVFTANKQVCVSITSGRERIVIVAAVASIERDLILGTDAMARLKISLQVDNHSIVLPRKRPLGREC